MTTLRLYDINRISETAKKFLKVTAGNKKFAFYGKMGAGKTTFIIALCKELGAVDIVNSPTFTIINEYRTDKGEMLYHLDFYRIKSADELLSLGIEDYLYEDVYCFIEWPDRAEDIITGNIIKVNIEEVDTDKRLLKIHI
jgi:tRNA threonylcarbamoyladenosine biosynthesis protein TsaE